MKPTLPITLRQITIFGGGLIVVAALATALYFGVQKPEPIVAMPTPAAEKIFTDEERARADAAAAVVPSSDLTNVDPKDEALENDEFAEIDGSLPDAVPETGSQALDPTVTAGLAYLDEIRAIPGAAPLLDDILEFLKADDGASFSLDHLEHNENGLAKVDANTNRKMIKNPAIQAKWEKLMALIAANGALGRTR